MNKGDYKILAGFITLDPPLIHKRVKYKLNVCERGCRACAYLKRRAEAVETLCKIQEELEQE